MATMKKTSSYVPPQAVPATIVTTPTQPETTPLPYLLLTSKQHGGVEPESSLIYIYTFEPDCSTLTNVFLTGSLTSCAPLSGVYYSPAICPSGWTAALSRPVDGDVGPPVEADETAMLCCPIGMTTLPVSANGCGPMSCISTTVVPTRTSELSIELLAVRKAIQIRWASSDLAILETHPLTPGLIPTERVLASNYTGLIPPLKPKYGVALGLSFIPIVLAAVLTLFGLGLRKKKRSRTAEAAEQELPAQTYRPGILSWPPLALLIGVGLAAIALLELSCHVLPTAEDLLDSSNIRITKVFVSDVTLLRTDQAASNSANAPTPLDLTCTISGSYSVSRFVTSDRGAPTEATRTYGGTPICVVSESSVLLPTCYAPTEAPPGDKWLASSQDGGAASEAHHFVAAVLPTLLAVLFAIPFQIIHLHAASLEPFHQLAMSSRRRGGTTLSRSLLADYTSFSAMSALVPGLTFTLVYASAILAPLAAEAWEIALFGVCAADESKGCVPVMRAIPELVRVLEGVLAFVVVLVGGLVFVLRGWTAGVMADPRSVLGIAALAHGPGVVEMFRPLRGEGVGLREVKERVGGLRAGLGTFVAPAGHGEFGFVVEWGSRQIGPGYLDGGQFEGTQAAERPVRVGKMVATLLGFAALLVGLATLIAYYRLRGEDTMFERFMSSQGFGPRFLFTSCGLVASFLWAAVFRDAVIFASFLALSRSRPSAPDASILLPYAIDPYSNFFRSFLRGDLLLAAISLATIFSVLLPVPLANVPFNRTRTFATHIVCSWISIGVLIFMVLVLAVLVAVILAVQPEVPFVDTKLLRKSPIAAILIILSSSGEIMGYFHGLSTLGGRQRDRRIREMMLRYRLVRLVDAEGGHFTALDIVPP